MPGKTITVDILPDGTVSIETTGYKGKDCLKATEALEKALGTKTEEKFTREFNQHGTTNVTTNS